MKRIKIMVLLTAALVTAPLLYFSTSPTALVRIDVHPNSLSGVRILTTSTLIERGSRGIVYFDFRALADTQVINSVSISIRPSTIAEWFRAHDTTVSNGLILSTLQLGSTEYPIGKDARFAYKLVADPSTVLSEGTLMASSVTVAGTEPWLISAIAVLASVLQVLTVAFSRNTHAQESRFRHPRRS